jgi:hypothetical protein
MAISTIVIQVLTTSAVTAGLIGLATFLLKGLVMTRLKETVSYEYKRSFEEFKATLTREEKRRQQASEVGKLIGLWASGGYDKDIDQNRLRLDIQTRYWELALWLDAGLVRGINQALIQDRVGQLHKEALLAARKLLVGAEDDLTTADLIDFPPRLPA